MKKIVIAIITIVFVLTVVIGINIYSYQQRLKTISKNNKTYESFYNVEVLGTDVASLINKIIDNNTKNNIKKDEKGKYIEDNNENLILLNIKFLEIDDVIPIESLEKQGVDRFIKNFGAATFKCTKIEYYENTKGVKSLYFEEI